MTTAIVGTGFGSRLAIEHTSVFSFENHQLQDVLTFFGIEGALQIAIRKLPGSCVGRHPLLFCPRNAMPSKNASRPANMASERSEG
jgi:hypothetical protein